MEQKNLTGYPHIDKPWMKYYKDLKFDDNNYSHMVEYLKEKNKFRKSLIAESYYGKEFTYDEMLFDTTSAKALSSIGIKRNDLILNLVPNLKESGEIWFGATQIGAISDYIDPRPDSTNMQANANKLLEIIKFEKPNYIVALDMCYIGMIKPIEKELKELGIKGIVTISASDSMNLKGKIDYMKDVINYNSLKNARNLNSNVKKLSWYQALQDKLSNMKKMEEAYNKATSKTLIPVYKYTDLKNNVKYENLYKIIAAEDEINYIGHTSGTSGARPKPITATNKNIISKLNQMEMAGVNFDTGDRVLRILPLFAPFGAFDNYLLTLSSGAISIDVPEFDISEFGYLIKKYRPNIIIATPAWLAQLPNYKYLQNLDLSCIKKMTYGGDSMSEKDEENLNAWLKNHGSNAIVRKGYGMSEFLGCGTHAKNEYNKYGSIGIPIPGLTLGIVDPNIDDKLVPLKFEEGKDKLEGEIIVSGNSVTNGVLHENVIVPHYELDGESYIRTRDLMAMDRDGIFYHLGRKDRSFARFDGYKIKPYEIESIIESHPLVKQARVVEYYDENYRGIMPICHITLNNENIENIDSIKLVNEIVYDYIIKNPTMSSRQIPSKFKIRENMPLTKNSKVDFNKLKNEPLDNTEINVSVEETNLSVGSINISYANKEKVLKLKKD